MHNMDETRPEVAIPALGIDSRTALLIEQLQALKNLSEKYDDLKNFHAYLKLVETLDGIIKSRTSNNKKGEAA